MSWQRAGSSADRRAGKVDLLERALCLFAISSLLRVRTLKPRPLSPFPLTVVADSQLVCAGVLNSLIGVRVAFGMLCGRGGAWLLQMLVGCSLLALFF